MNKLLILAGLSLCFCSNVHAQFSTHGTIEYVKTTNIHLAMKLEFEEEFGGNMEQVLKMVPKNATKHYVMTFDENKSMFRFDKDGPEKLPEWGGKDPASENIVYKDLKSNTYTAEKEFFDNFFIIKDSIPQYKWKLDDEIRQIAGYNCRKATTVIFDSVVVIAFYADEIMVSNGPESFGGLPGMILGLAVPRLYSSWFATKVELGPYNAGLEKPVNKKGKEVSFAELNKILSERLKEWGKYGTQTIYKVGL